MAKYRWLATLILLAVFCPLVDYSQEQNQLSCGFDDLIKNLSPNDLTSLREEKITNQVSASTIYTIPVVFHVLHQGGAENISDAQILDEMDILNRDYRKKNADTANIIPAFQSLAADVGFEFHLATKDPNGNCTNGIVRHFDGATNWISDHYVASQYKYTWDPTKYLNIYVVAKIGSGITAGYAYPPGIVNTPGEDIVVVIHQAVGSIGTGHIIDSRTLTHEIGHWFSLLHLWGNTTMGTVCGDDGITDTPVTKGFNNCPTGSAAICNSTIVENYQNYMDYTSCRVMFTIGQANRMVTAINSSDGGRNNLSTLQNLSETGVNSPIGPCLPVAEFYTEYNGVPDAYTVCEGQVLTFVDASYNGTVISRSWTGTPGVSIASPTSSRTAVTFTQPGWNFVTLTVTNSVGTSTISKVVNVLSSLAEVQESYSESFETPGLPLNFSVINPDNDITWTQTDTCAATGWNSFYIFGGADSPGHVDILETPSYNFQNDPQAAFTFKYAYARSSSSSADVFKVQVSSNCGGSWTDVYYPSITAFANASGGNSTTHFYPHPEQFVTVDVSSQAFFSQFVSQGNVRFRFYFQEDKKGGGGNNIFLDDINFSRIPDGLTSYSKSDQTLKIYPVPASSYFKIEYYSTVEAETSIRILDCLGRICLLKSFPSAGKTHNEVRIDEQLSPGIYLAVVTIGSKVVSKTLVIE